jgi:hypothetical protein
VAGELDPTVRTRLNENVPLTSFEEKLVIVIVPLPPCPAASHTVLF